MKASTFLALLSLAMGSSALPQNIQWDNVATSKGNYVLYISSTAQCPDAVAGYQDEATWIAAGKACKLMCPPVLSHGGSMLTASGFRRGGWVCALGRKCAALRIASLMVWCALPGWLCAKVGVREEEVRKDEGVKGSDSAAQVVARKGGTFSTALGTSVLQ